MSVASFRALSNFYFCKASKDTGLLSLALIGLCLAFLPLDGIISPGPTVDADQISIIDILRIVPPLIGFILSLQWFCWVSDIDFIDKDSCLPKILATLPVKTSYLAIIPLVSGIVLIMLFWLPWRLDETGSQRLHLSIISAASFIWIQAILLQPMPLQGARIPLILTVGLIFITVLLNWNSELTRSLVGMRIIPLSAVILYGVIGFFFNLVAVQKARHSRGKSISLPAIFLRRVHNVRHSILKSGIQAHIYFENRLYRLNMSITYLFILFIIMVPFLIGNQRELLYGWIVVSTISNVLIMAPIVIAFVSGLGRGSLQIDKDGANTDQFSPFFAALPLDSLDFMKAKMLMAIRNILYSYTIFFLIGLYLLSIVLPMDYIFLFVLNSFSNFKIALISYSIFLIGLTMSILAQLSAFWMSLVLAKYNIPKISIYLGGIIILGILLHYLGLYVTPSLLDTINDNTLMISIFVCILALMKMTFVIILLIWLHKHGKGFSFYSPLIAVWILMIVPLVCLGHLIIHNNLSMLNLLLTLPGFLGNIVFILLCGIIICPMVSILISFPALYYSRFK